MELVGEVDSLGGLSEAGQAGMSLTVVGVVEVAEGRVVTPAVRRVVPRGHALSATRLKTTESHTCGERQVFLTASHLPCGQRRPVTQAAKGRRLALCSPLGASSSRQTSAWWPCRSLQRSRELRRRAAAGRGRGLLFRGMAAKPLTGSAGL